MKAIKVSLSIVILILVAYVSYTAVYEFNHHVNVNVVLRSEGFSGYTLKISENDINKALDHAKQQLDKKNGSYRVWENVEIFATWTAFLLSCIITVIAGYNGQFTKPTDVTDEKFLKTKVGKIKLIGLFAALATVITGVSVKAKQQASDQKQNAVELRDAIIASYKDIQNARTDTDARIAIEKLQSKADL